MILIAGGSGFFGKNIARCLAERGEEVLLVQRHSMNPPPFLVPFWGKQIKQELGSILDLSLILDLVKSYKVDAIVHAASETHGWYDLHPGAVLNPQGWHIRERFETEVIGTVNCLDATRLMGLQRMVFVSSCDNYRGLPHQPEVFDEDAFLPPVAYSPDGNCKRAADMMGFMYSKGYGFEYITIRLGSNYGVGCHSAINRMVEGALEGVEADLSMRAANRRTHAVSAKSSAEGACALLLAKKPLEHHIYNLAFENPTMQEIADTVKEVLPGAKIKLGPPSNEKADNLEYRPQSMERIKKELGFSAMTLREGIEHYARFLKTGEY